MLPRLAADVVGEADLTQPHLHFKVPALPAQLPILRTCLRDWTHQIGLAGDRSDDIVLAVDEAVANAVEHAYAGGQSGSVVLFAACERGTHAARVIVSDDGTWQPPTPEPGFRGRGVPIMQQLADEFDLHHDARGTTVVLGWQLP